MGVNTGRRIDLLTLVVIAAVILPGLRASGVAIRAQTEINDGELEQASAGRTVTVGTPATGRMIVVPLEVYVARVLAGEGEPGAPDAAVQALAIAIRSFALANAGRHRRDGFDLCDTTHCQVLRTANATTRRAALATVGQVLSYNGVPVEVFYSASCGGRSEAASAVWPRASVPYLPSIEDDVHADDPPWTLETSLEEVRQVLARVGFDGRRLTDVRIDSHTVSGRVARLKLAGLRPDVIDGEQFRRAMGWSTLKSTAFTVKRHGSSLQFSGRGYGHGVGMCVIGAARRARRGESADAILSTYYPGLQRVGLDRLADRAPAATVPVPERAAGSGAKSTGTIVARVPRGSTMSAGELERLAASAHDSLSRTLGTSTAPVTVELYESLDSFRSATGSPWWVSAVVSGTTIDLAPASLLAQRNGVDAVLRTAMAELLIAPALVDRPAWVRVGAARYFAQPARKASESSRVRCPSDAELTLAISASAQRDAESRAEACFAHRYAQTKDWRRVR